MAKRTYKGVELTNVGISWYVAVDGRDRHAGMSLAEAKRWVDAHLGGAR